LIHCFINRAPEQAPTVCRTWSRTFGRQKAFSRQNGTKTRIVRGGHAAAVNEQTKHDHSGSSSKEGLKITVEQIAGSLLLANASPLRTCFAGRARRALRRIRIACCRAFLTTRRKSFFCRLETNGHDQPLSVP